MKSLSQSINEKLVINKDYTNPDDLNVLHSFLEPIYNYNWKHPKMHVSFRGRDDDYKINVYDGQVFNDILECFITVSKKYRSTALPKCYVYYNEEEKDMVVFLEIKRNVGQAVFFYYDKFDTEKLVVEYTLTADGPKEKQNRENANYKHFKMPLAAIIDVCKTLKLGVYH